MDTKNIIIGITVLAALVIAYFLLGFGGQRSTLQNQDANRQQETVVPTPEKTSTVPPSTDTSSATTPAGLAMHAVVIETFAFTPKVITVKKGDTVTWKNADDASHTVSGDNGGPASKTLRTGDTYSFTFSKAGTFPYHCSFHPSMTGAVVVTE